MKSKLLKAAGLIGALTLVSRILGMIRDIASAHHFGTTWQWDAFIYAFMLPNFLRRLVGEGALSSAFIPVYTQLIQKEGEAAAFRFVNVIFTLLATTLVGFLGIAEVILFFLVRIPSPSARRSSHCSPSRGSLSLSFFHLAGCARHRDPQFASPLFFALAGPHHS